MNRKTWREIVSIRERMHAGGWHVLPVVERSKGPQFARWPDYAYDPVHPEPQVPRTRNAAGERTRIAHLGTGAKTLGIVAVDIDIDHGERAQAALVAFQQAAGIQAPLVRYRNGSPRRLLVYAAASDVVRTSDSQGSEGAKIEIFAQHAGKQVFLHGVHPSGEALKFEGDAPEDAAVSALPILSAALLNSARAEALRAAGIERRAPRCCIHSGATTPLRAFNGLVHPYARAALRNACAAVAASPKGERNKVLFKAAASLGALAAGGALSPHAVAAALVTAARACGLTADDSLAAVEATIASGLKRGRENPRALPPRKAGDRHAC